MNDLSERLDFYEREGRGILLHVLDDAAIDGAVDLLAGEDCPEVRPLCDDLRAKGEAYFAAGMLLARVRRARLWLAGDRWKAATPDEMAAFASECIGLGAAVGVIAHDALRPLAEQGRKFRVEGPKRKRRRTGELYPVLERAVAVYVQKCGIFPSVTELYLALEDLADTDPTTGATIRLIDEDAAVIWRQSSGKEHVTQRKTIANWLSTYRKKIPPCDTAFPVLD